LSLSQQEIRAIYRETQIIRKPTYGIISGYHELPFVLLGESFEAGRATTRVRGKVQVSPRLIMRPPSAEPSYDEVFGEEHVDALLVGRVFGFMGFRDKPVECKSEYLHLEHLDRSLDAALGEVLDDIEYREDITMGVIISPNAQYFPVSIERFIASILDDELSL